MYKVRKTTNGVTNELTGEYASEYAAYRAMSDLVEKNRLELGVSRVHVSFPVAMDFTTPDGSTVAYDVIDLAPEKADEGPKDGERYVVASYECMISEDNYEHGIVPGGKSSIWTEEDFPVVGTFATPREAIDAVLKANRFSDGYDFENDPISENDYGRFDTDITVDEKHKEVDDKSELYAKWVGGDINLFECHVVIHLAVSKGIRPMTAEEAKGV